MGDTSLAERVAARMMELETFTHWLGIEHVELGAGHCTLKMKVRNEMLNGHETAHGGITYSLADTALAFASNSHGKKAVSIETSISHLAPVYEGDVITAIAEETDLRNKIAIYQITVTNQDNKKVALFKGTVYRTGEEWFPNE